jgi:hypothetical protein
MIPEDHYAIPEGDSGKLRGTFRGSGEIEEMKAMGKLSAGR